MNAKRLFSTLFTRLMAAIMLATVVWTSGPASIAYAATSGPRFAGAGAEANGPGSIAWSNEANITADDTNYATTTLSGNGVSEYLQATNFGFTIPANAIINGIEVTIMRQSSSNQGGSSVDDADLYLLKGGTIVGDDYASSSDWPTSMQTANYGATNDLWGTGWTPAEINATNFGVALSVRNESNFANRTASVDYIQITITYTLPTTTVADGTSPASKTVGGSSANNAVSAFTLATNSGTDTVTGLVVTGGGSGLANVAANGVKIYRSANNEWDAGDTLVGTTSFVGTSATFTGLNLAVTTTVTNYIITYDIIATPTAGQTMTALVSGATATNTITNTDNTDATLTVGYTITVSAGPGGTIQYPYGTVVTGTIVVAPNATPTIYSVPDAGFVLSDVTVQGISVGRANTYIMPTVTGNRIFAATFDGGWYRPSATGAGSNWTNTANGYTSNNSWATSDDFPGENANYINFNFPAIPAGSTIDGIEVAYEGWTGNTNANVAISGDFGSSFAPTSLPTTFIPDVPDRTVFLGGPLNTWGSSTWAPSDFTNGEFYLRISSDNYAQLYLDQIQARVYYRQPTTLAVNAATGTYGGTVDLTGTLTTTVGSNPVSGQTITFYLNGANVGTAVTNASGVATLTNVSLAGINQGTYNGVFNTSGVVATYGGTAAGVLPGYLASNNAVNTLTVNPLGIEVTADDKTKTYGDADPALTYQITNGALVGSDSFTGALTRDAGESVAGSPYAITQGTLALSTNYTLTFVPGALTISQRDLEVTADDQAKIYGEADPALTYQITSGALAFSDAFSGDLTRVPGETVAGSPYAITQGTLTLGGNYNLTFVPGELTIGQRDITIAADNQTKNYGEADPALTYQITNGSLGFSDTISGSLTRDPGETVAGSPYAITQGSLALDGNYNLVFVPAQLTISSVTLTITANNDSKTYDGVAYSGGNGVAYSGFVAGDNETTALSGALTYTGSSQGAIDQGAYDITPGGLTANNGNYAINFVNGTLTINQLALTVSAAGVDKVYDGNADAIVILTHDGLPGDTLVLNYGSASFDDKNVGINKPVNVTGITVTGASAGNYTFNTTASTSANITPRPLTVISTGIDKVYDGNTSATVTLTDDHLSGDDLTVGYTSASFNDPDVGMAKPVNVSGISITGGIDAGNYSLVNTTDTTSADITGRILTVTATGSNKTYDGTTTASVTLVDDRLSGDDLTITYTAADFDTKHVGVNKPITVTGLSISGGASAGNYTLADTSATTAADIIERAITVLAVTDTKVYDGTTASTVAPIIIVGSIAPGDTPDFVQTFDNKNIGANKTLTPSGTVLDGNSGNNYVVTFNSVSTGEITGGIALTVTGISAADKVYDGDPTASLDLSAALLVGVNSGDIVTLDATGVAGAFSDENVGAGKTVSITGLTLSGPDAANYTLVQPSTTASITQRPLTISATGIDKVYDGNASATVNLSDDRVSGDLLTIDGLAAFNDKHVGNGKPVSVTGITVIGADSGNYTFNATAGTTANITPLALTLTAVADSKVYDTNNSSSATPNLSAPLVAGDTGVFTQTFDNENVGINKTLTPQAVIADGNNGNNYTIAITPDTNGVITGFPLSITGLAVNNKTYDSLTNATINTGSANLVGVFFGDIVNLNTGGINAQFSDPNVGDNKNVTITGVTLGGQDAGNYILTQPSGLTANILSRPITIMAAADTKVYDGSVLSTGVPTVISGSLAGSDALAFTQTFNTPAVGIGNKVLTAAGFVNDGNGGNNYAVSFTTNTGSITARPITVTANAQSKVVGDPDPAFTYSITSGSLVVGDSLSGTLTRVAGETVGSYPIQQGTLSAGTNYNLTYIGSNLTIASSNQVINVTMPAPASAIYSQSFPVAATATSGLPVIITTTGDCGGSGNGSAVITMTSGTGSCVVHYNQPGDANYSAAVEVLNTVNAQRANQTITPTTSAPANAIYNTTFNVAATASSGLTVSFSASGACTNLGNIFTMSSGTGTCTVQYDQAGDNNYLAAPSVIQSVNAQRASQAININTNAPANAPLNASFTVAATTTSGLPVNYSALGVCTNVGATFTMTSGSGTCTVEYSQPGDANYAAAPTRTEDVTANNGSQVINVTTHAPASEVYNNSFTVVATATSGLPVDIASSGSCSGSGLGNASITVTSGSGTCTITYTQAGDTNYSAATPITEFTTAQKAAQTITVNPHAPATSPNGTSFNVAATASSGLPVSITVTGACTGSGTGSANVNMNSATGVCTVLFNQPGNANYLAADEVTETTAATALPVVSQQPVDTTAIVGGTASFTAAAVGNPTPTIQWQVSTDGGNTFTDLPGANSTTLTITASATDNGNEYRAVFTNTEGTATSNPASLTIDTVAPTIITNGIGSNANTGDGHLDEMEITSVAITQLIARFSEAMRDPAGNNAADDVTNPVNYLLVKDNGDGFQTVSCSAGITGGDIPVTIDSVAYNSLSYAATLTVNGNSVLNSGVYRLIVCGTTSVTDVAGNKLAGNGSTTGTDFTRNFVVARADGGGNNGGGNSGGNSNNGAKTADYSNLLIPVTGFAPGVVTELPAQNASQAYAAYSGLMIEIPSLKVKAEVVGVPTDGTSWDVSWLGNNAGFLEGSAFPTTLGNSIITAHVWDANNNPGTFYGLKNLKYGDKVLIHAWGKVYTYEIRTQTRLLPGSIKSLWKHESLSWITLITCEDYNEKTDKYAYRRVVRAILVSVTDEK